VSCACKMMFRPIYSVGGRRYLQGIYTSIPRICFYVWLSRRRSRVVSHPVPIAAEAFLSSIINGRIMLLGTFVTDIYVSGKLVHHPQGLQVRLLCEDC
jgi:hypothetical protein